MKQFCSTISTISTTKFRPSSCLNLSGCVKALFCGSRGSRNCVRQWPVEGRLSVRTPNGNGWFQRMTIRSRQTVNELVVPAVIPLRTIRICENLFFHENRQTSNDHNLPKYWSYESTRLVIPIDAELSVVSKNSLNEIWTRYLWRHKYSTVYFGQIWPIVLNGLYQGYIKGSTELRLSGYPGRMIPAWVEQVDTSSGLLPPNSLRCWWAVGHTGRQPVLLLKIRLILK